MPPLIEKTEFIKATQLDKFNLSGLVNPIMKALRLTELNEFYSRFHSSSSIDFVEKALETFEISFDVSSTDLLKLPKDGAFITISNHPYGGIDGLLLIKLMLRQQPDFKVVANYLLSNIKPLEPHIIKVNPFEGKESDKQNFIGLKSALKHLKNGHSLGIFPAGEVSSFHKNEITDKVWNKGILKFIKKAEVPVVPIYFDGNNSAIFHLLGAINPKLRTIKLPSEVLNKGKKTIHIRIGKPISVAEQAKFKDIDKYGRFLRSKTYAQGSSIEVKRFFKYSLKRKSKAEEIALETPCELVIKDIEALPADRLILTSSHYQVFCAKSKEIPSVLKEIGRLREQTYREVGEGTNRAQDLDEFDIYYHQLIIWDKEQKRIVGGYRVGKGADIIKALGIKGFYLNQLFKIKKPLWNIFEQSLELGRSYIIKEYQKKPLPLFLLWKGIIALSLKHTEYRYLIGPVSISNQFCGFSKHMLIQFLTKYYFNPDFAKHVKPRNKFSAFTSSIDTDILLEASEKDLAKLDKIIQEIEPLGLNLPVLFKKYIQQNAKIIGFNIDPKFNNALDGFMILDVQEIPQNTMSSLTKELENPILEKVVLERNLG